MSPAARHQVSCVLPAFNEAASLGVTVAEWAAMLETCTRDYEIIVVDDGSTDDSVGVLRALSDRHQRLRIIRNERNLGYGASIAAGFAQARFPLLFFTDSDGQYDPEDFLLLLDRIPHAAIVTGYRLRRADPAFRSLLSRGYNLLARWLVGVALRDLNCAFKLMHRDTFRRLAIAETGFLVNAELTMNARAAGLTIIEIPVRHRSRRAGRTTVRPLHVLAGIYGLIRLRARGRVVPEGRPIRSETGVSDEVAAPRSLAR